MGESLSQLHKAGTPYQNQILLLASDQNSLILDSFTGSGTTAHAITESQRAGRWKAALHTCRDRRLRETITAERVRRAMSGYGDTSKATDSLGGFDYYTVGEPMFLPDENLNRAVGAKQSRLHWPTTKAFQLTTKPRRRTL